MIICSADDCYNKAVHPYKFCADCVTAINDTWVRQAVTPPEIPDPDPGRWKNACTRERCNIEAPHVHHSGRDVTAELILNGDGLQPGDRVRYPVMRTIFDDWGKE